MLNESTVFVRFHIYCALLSDAGFMDFECYGVVQYVQNKYGCLGQKNSMFNARHRYFSY